MAYFRNPRRRFYSRTPRVFGGFRQRRFSRYSRPSYRVGVFRRKRVPRRTSYQRKSRRAQSSGVSCCNSTLDPGQKFILAQADPFEPRSFGGKIPDSSTIPSIPTPIQYNYSLATPGGGTGAPNMAHAWQFAPCLQSCNVAAMGVNPTSWTWSVASGAVLSDAPQNTTFGTSFEAFRPVAHGIRLSCPFAPTAATGFVHIALAVETVYSTPTVAAQQYIRLATDLSQMSGYTFYKRVTLASLTQSPITLINKWTDETAFRYSSPFASPTNANNSGTASANTFHVPLSWGTLLVAVEGVSTVTTAGTSITPLQAEVVLHTENIPDKSGALIGSTAAAYDSAVLNAVSQGAAGSDFAHTEAAQEQHINSYMSQVAEAAGNNPAIRQMARSVGNGIMNAAMNAVLGYAGGIPGVNANPNQLRIQ
ncbi:MAG: capsid protein [Cressdnaviricota sp.]|nr:MAG: capsid protein [Cressdnaviricota sp.]